MTKIKNETMFCPFCQAPMSLINIRSKNMHLETCFRSKKPKEECTKGLKCNSNMLCHFKKYAHTELALMRSTKLQNCSPISVSSEDCCTDEETKITSENFGSIFKKSQLISEYMKTGSDQNKTSIHGSGDHNNTACMSTNQSLNKPLVQCDNLKPDIPIKSNKNSTACSLLNETPSLDKKMDKKLLNELDVSSTKTVNSKIPSNLILNEECNLSNIKTEKIDECFNSIENNETNNMIQKSSGKLNNSSTVDQPNIDHTCKRKKDHKFDMSVKKIKIENINSTSSNSLLKTATNFPGCSTFKNGMKNGNIAKFFGFKVESKVNNSSKEIKSLNSTPKNLKIQKYKKSNEIKIKKCPFYKKIEFSKIAVDAFNYGVIPDIEYYFLSHFHYDHFIGLTNKWKNKIYCSEITAELVKMRFKNISYLVVALPLNKQITIDTFKVTLLEANHCPGAVIFVFEFENGTSILHSGDFRANEKMVNDLTRGGYYFSTIYLDTTYLDSKYSFPPQDKVIEFTTLKVIECLQKYPDTLVISGTYTIGKERVFIDIAKKLQKKICVEKQKLNILKCFKDKNLNSMLTLNPYETNIHVVQMNKLSWPSLKTIYARNSHIYSKLLAIKPTGWTFTKCKNSELESLKIDFEKNIILMEIPYSEHSSFSELKNFVEALKPNKIIPTVNVGNPNTRSIMNSYLNKWKSSV